MVVLTSDSPGGSNSEESACNAGDTGSIRGRKDPFEGGMATHASGYLENSTDRGVWLAKVHGIAMSKT